MWKWLLKQVMGFIVGRDVFGKIQTLVSDVALNEKLSGSQKKEKVLKEAKDLGKDFATHMLNLAIEAAVVLLKSK